MKVLAPGLLTTVQDLGRIGFGKDGVSPSGAMDREALRVANLLVDNGEGAAGLEITFEGPRIEFTTSTLVSVCGADLEPRIASAPLLGWCAALVQEGAVLEFGAARWGCRAYVAVAGGIDVPEVMHSRSTYLRAGIGGLEGRALRSDDELPLGRIGAAVQRIMATTAENLGPLPFALTSRRLRDAERLYTSGPIRFLRGPDWEMLDADDQSAFLGGTFRVSPESDRMGHRLRGPVLRSPAGAEMTSTAVITGTVQLPPGGEPIVLTADRQTTGGYPMIAQVIHADLGTVAQLRPGDEIRFEETTIEEAHRAIRHIEEVLDELRGVEERASSGP